MEYFLITQSDAVVNPVNLLEIDASAYTPGMTHEDFSKLKRLSIAYYYLSADLEMPGILKYPTYMISDSIKRILALYNESISFKGIQVFPVAKDAPGMDKEVIKKNSKLYWVYDVIQLNCLSSETVFLPNGDVQEIILDRRRLRPVNVFRPRGLMENYLIVTLPVAESILRRNEYGVGVKRVQVR